MSEAFVYLYWSEEDRCFVAEIPEFAPCAAFGDTEEKALELMGFLMRAWLDAAKQWRMPIPAETERRVRAVDGK